MTSTHKIQDRLLVKEVGAFFTQGMTEEQAEDVKKAITDALVLASSTPPSIVPSYVYALEFFNKF